MSLHTRTFILQSQKLIPCQIEIFLAKKNNAPSVVEPSSDARSPLKMVHDELLLEVTPLEKKSENGVAEPSLDARSPLKMVPDEPLLEVAPFGVAEPSSEVRSSLKRLHDEPLLEAALLEKDSANGVEEPSSDYPIQKRLKAEA